MRTIMPKLKAVVNPEREDVPSIVLDEASPPVFIYYYDLFTYFSGMQAEEKILLRAIVEEGLPSLAARSDPDLTPT